MSCWVVPSVAADLWGMRIEDLMESIRRGEVPSREEYHFLLVDVAPDSPQMPPPQPYKAKPASPATFATLAVDEDEMEEEDASAGGPLNFRAARQKAARHRRRPAARAAA